MQALISLDNMERARARASDDRKRQQWRDIGERELVVARLIDGRSLRITSAARARADDNAAAAWPTGATTQRAARPAHVRASPKRRRDTSARARARERSL